MNLTVFTESGQGNISRGNLVKGPIIGGPFTLVDTENQIVTEKNLLGNWVLLYFGYTSSPDVGPEEVQVMSKAIDKLGWPLHLALYNFSFYIIFHELLSAFLLTLYFHLVPESIHNARVLPVFVTIDPQRDTPAQLRAYLRGRAFSVHTHTPCL